MRGVISVTLGLRQIRYFIAIADAGVLSRAAETLNVAQSALSHHVAALETDLGVKLLERRPRGIALTAAGRRLYEHASALLHDEDLYLVGHPSLIGRSSAPIAFSAIPQRSVVGLTPMPASRAIIQTQVLRNQITPSETLEVDSLSALRMALEAGLGCAIL